MPTPNSREELRKQILDEMNARRVDGRTYIYSEWLLSELDKLSDQDIKDIKAKCGVESELDQPTKELLQEAISDPAIVEQAAILGAEDQNKKFNK